MRKHVEVDFTVGFINPYKNLQGVRYRPRIATQDPLKRGIPANADGFVIPSERSKSVSEQIPMAERVKP